MDKTIRIAVALIALGFAIFSGDLFAYFFAIYHIAPGYWPWHVWYGIPAFTVFTLIAAAILMLAAACFSVAMDSLKPLGKNNTEKKPDGYESPVIKV